MKDLITLVIISILITIIVIQKACSDKTELSKKDTTVVTNIVNKVIHDTIYTTPKIIKTVFPTKLIPSKYVPDTNCAVLKEQYQKLVIEHFSKNVYKEKLKLDTLGNIVITDTTQFNKLGTRSYQLNLNIPTRIDSVFVKNTIYAPLQRQVYLGVGIITNQTINALGIRGSLLYKDKKDNIFSPSITINKGGTIMYGVDLYFKIKLK